MDVGAAKAVDRLVRVADHRQVAALSGEQLEPAVLDRVGVLVLVHQDLTERLLVGAAHLREQLEHVDRADEQVVEVHRIHAVQLALVARVDVGDRALEERADQLRVGLRVAHAVLGVRDLIVDRRRGEALGVDPVLLHAALDQPARIGLVVDRELARVAELVGVGTEHPRAGRVEGHDPHRTHAAADQQLSAIPHLRRSLVGERDRQDLARLNGPGGDQVGDPVREHTRLARAGAGQDQQRTVAVGHGVPLRVVQPVQQRLDLFTGLDHRLFPTVSGTVVVTDELREVCAWVAARSTLVRVVEERDRAAYAHELGVASCRSLERPGDLRRRPKPSARPRRLTG